jgi:hypothetical protein
MLVVFHRPLGLADYWQWIFLAVCVVAQTSFFVLRKRQKAALSAAGTLPAAPPRPNRKIMWLSLALIIATSLSSFLWLPYTGVPVSRTQLIMISITTCILSITACLIVWRRSHRV